LHGLVASRVRDDPGEVEHHRECPDDLADRLAFEAVLRECRYEGRDVGCGDRINRSIAETIHDPYEPDAVARVRARGHVDAREAPALSDGANRLDGHRLKYKREVRHAERRKLASDPVAPDLRLALSTE